MANRGKSINLFLMDGDVTGRIKCTIAGWTGVVYKIPRTELDNSKERSHLKQSGVYFLFGTSDQTGESKRIYTVMPIVKEGSVTAAQAEQVVKQNANVLAREVEKVKKQAEIREAEAKTALYREEAAATNNPSALAEARARYEAQKQEIANTLKEELATRVAETAKELTQKSTEEILQKAEDKKKIAVEDDIRARLRGFARTIPSFLIQYRYHIKLLGSHQSSHACQRGKVPWCKFYDYQMGAYGYRDIRNGLYHWHDSKKEGSTC